MSKVVSLRARHLAWGAFGALVLSSSAIAASDTRSAQEQYKADVALCNSGQSNQDKRTCLQEAGAALGEARKNNLVRGGSQYDQNAVQRCQALPSDSRAACEAQMAGQGKTYGSVLGGGVLREMTVQVPAGSPGSVPAPAGGAYAPAPAGSTYAPPPPPPAGGAYAPAPAGSTYGSGVTPPPAPLAPPPMPAPAGTRY